MGQVVWRFWSMPLFFFWFLVLGERAGVFRSRCVPDGWIAWTWGNGNDGSIVSLNVIRLLTVIGWYQSERSFVELFPWFDPLIRTKWLLLLSSMKPYCINPALSRVVYRVVYISYR